MSRNRIRENVISERQRLAAFMSGTERVFEFSVDCAFSERIDFIYAVIFPGFARYRFFVRFFLARIAQLIDYSPVKVFLYRLIGIKIGKGVLISPDVMIDSHFPNLIELGDYAILGWGAHLFTHEFSGNKYRMGHIRIGEGAVIGGFTDIRGGVDVGDGVDVPPYCIVYKDFLGDNFLNSIILRKRTVLEFYEEKNHER